MSQRQHGECKSNKKSNNQEIVGLNRNTEETTDLSLKSTETQ